MASTAGFLEYVCEQIADAGIITHRKMMGEYVIYCNGKVIGDVCDNQFFLKKTVAGLTICPDCKEAPPYEGAKPYLIMENLDDREFMTKMVVATYEELPEPKLKKKEIWEKNR